VVPLSRPVAFMVATSTDTSTSKSETKPKSVEIQGICGYRFGSQVINHRSLTTVHGERDRRLSAGRATPRQSSRRQRAW
jgi:hypothetical protein